MCAVAMSIRDPSIISIAWLFHVSVLHFQAICDPIIPRLPFVVFWNAPTHPCLTNYNVSLDLDAFNIVVNQNHSFVGTEVVIFYHNQLGLYPYYNQDNEPVNGGLPQNCSLDNHLGKAQKDLEAIFADENFEGVAVVDWEEWRPLWERNWENKTLYQLRSQQLIIQRLPQWSYGRLKHLAKRQFEAAAKELMILTMMKALELSPKGLWGFYGFPECYNYGYKNSSQKYTGQCPDDEMRRNDAMDWLWRISQAIYPHIYLDKYLKNSEHVGAFVKHRVQEALRVSADLEIPVLPYARIVYTYSMDFLIEDDLIKTIGQSAALGASGIVLWGNTNYSCSKESCLAVKRYIEEILAPYLRNVTMAATLCSQELCSNNGRCVRKVQDSDVYLHLDPQLFTIQPNPFRKGFVVYEYPTTKKPEHMWHNFRCCCYKGWQGSDCSLKKH